MKYVAYWNKEDDEIVNEVITAKRCEKGRLWPICITHVPTGGTDGCRSLWPDQEPVAADRIITEAHTFLGIVVKVERIRNKHNAEASA